jgi:hypothetical protein
MKHLVMQFSPTSCHFVVTVHYNWPKLFNIKQGHIIYIWRPGG